MKLEVSDYKYISIIIILLALMYFVVLPYTYKTYNGSIDAENCIADMNTIQCYTAVDNPNDKMCEFNCTFINATTARMKIYPP